MTTAETVTHDWGDTVRIRAEVQTTGSMFTGFLHLLPNSSAHLGPETPNDMLNRVEAFFALTDDQDHTAILAKAQVILVAVEHDGERDPDRFSAARTIDLKVELSDGSEHAGTVIAEQPPTRTRAIDFLNHGAGFFGLHTSDTVRYINRLHVRAASPSS